jgi:crotonobetainyl-CoA:carnitine CoA-transferase CaiB-like acyl-CoA transferase
MGNAHPNIVPYQTFRTRDGDLILAIGNDSQFAKFCAAAGIPEVARDARFVDNESRVANREECFAAIGPAIPAKTTGEWIQVLEPLGVPCGPINNLEAVYSDPQVQHRKLKIDVPHPLAGAVPLVANPIKYSRTPLTYDMAPPLLGEHTEEVLTRLLGKSKSDVDTLRSKGVI